jgi:pyridoxal phosphate enzyme (YggS family)
LASRAAVTDITEKLAALRERVRLAAAVSGRATATVTIVAVSKTHPVETIARAREAGLRDFGENYVQEAVAKVTSLPDDVAWHYIGALQANKTRAIAAHFQWAQTLTSASVAGRLSRQRPHYAGELQVCLQVQPLPANGRGGVAEADVPRLAAEVAALPRLKLRGLMFMPRPALDEPALRAEFRRVRRLFEALCAGGHALDTLSMGMSDDLAIAIAEGSTMVRVGTALFGRRESAL